MDHIGRFIFSAAAFVLSRSPAGLRRFMARSGAWLHYISSPGKRKNVRSNLTGIGASADPASVLRVFRHHADNMVEIFAASRWDADTIRVKMQDPDTRIIADALTRGRGVILVTVHAGNWEIGALYMSNEGYGMHVVAGVQMNRVLTGAVKDAKERLGIEVINPENSYRKLFKALEANGIVALLLDGDLFTGGHPVELFGKRIEMPDGAIQLSMRTGAPIIGGYCRRIGHERYEIHLEEILDPLSDGHVDEEESINMLYSRIEDFISANRDQWCMFRDFWGDRT